MKPLARLVSFWWLLAASSSAGAADSFAAMSLVGHELTIVVAQATTGTRRDANVHQVVPIAERTFDLVALKAIDAALRKAHPAATLLMLAANDPRWTAAAKQGLAPDSSEYVSLVEGLAKAAEKANAERLLIVLPARNEILLRMEGGNIGHGRVAGLGLYVDRHYRMRRSDTGEWAEGFLGVFANFRVVLVDTRTSKVLGEEIGSVGSAYSAARSPDGDPLNALTGNQKLQTIERLLRDEITRVLPALLARSP